MLYRVPEIGTPSGQHFLEEITTMLPLLLANGVPDNDPLAKMEFLKRSLRDAQLLKQELQESSVEGHQWLDYTLTVKLPQDEQPIEVLFRVDPKTKLPHWNRVTGQYEGQSYRFEAKFDYPQTGPKDIYALGTQPEYGSSD